MIFNVKDLESYRGSPEFRDQKNDMQLEQQVWTSRSCRILICQS